MQVTFEIDDTLYEKLSQVSQQKNLSVNELTTRLYQQVIQSQFDEDAVHNHTDTIHPELTQLFGKYNEYARTPTIAVEEMNEGIAKFHQDMWHRS